MADEVSIEYIDRKIDLSMICNFPPHENESV